MKASTLTTNRKALTINIDSQIYGTIAEIGAGQEVAAYFFKAGGAAGTIAKTMSAYDMLFSDKIYGKAQRYVSKERLQQMLNHEYNLLNERLSETRGKNTCFFVFADTVAARNYRGTNECHGWMGLKYQLRPETEPNEIIVHVRMLDKTNVLQQEALGIFGVNLTYAAFMYHFDHTLFIESLADNIGKSRIEVDMIEFRGPDFMDTDNRVLALRLVKSGLTNAVLFSPETTVLQPSEALRKKCLLVERGSFRPVTKLNQNMLAAAGSQFVQEPEVMNDEVMILMEITMNNLLSAGFDINDFIARIDILSALGYHTLISNYPEYYRLSAYFRRYTSKNIGLVMGINHLLAIFTEEYYENLEGGILEAFGRLFKERIKLYVYPMQHRAYQHYKETQEFGTSKALDKSESPADLLITADNLQVSANLRNLFTYLKENHFIEPIHGYDLEAMSIFSRNILNQIRRGETDWESDVPAKVAEIIKERKLFNYGKDKKSEASHSTA